MPKIIHRYCVDSNFIYKACIKEAQVIPNFQLILKADTWMFCNYSFCYYIYILELIGNQPLGAWVAAAPPDKETNFLTRNQNLMNKQIHTRKGNISATHRK